MNDEYEGVERRQGLGRRDEDQRLDSIDGRLRAVEQDMSGIKWSLRGLVIVLTPIATAVLAKVI